jgi:hypothetical protein
MNARATWRVVIAAALLTLACGSCAFAPPSAPTPLPLPQVTTSLAPQPTTLATARAALEVASFELRFARIFKDTLYVYEPTITLRETRGQSHVTIESMFLTGERFGVFAFAAASCRGDGWTIAPWATSAATLHPGCDVSDPADFTGDAVRLTVIYRDDLGDVGQVTATSTVVGITGASPR